MATTTGKGFAGEFTREFDRLLLVTGFESGHILAKQHQRKLATVELTTAYTSSHDPSTKTNLNLQPPLSGLLDTSRFLYVRLQEMLRPFAIQYGEVRFEVYEHHLQETLFGPGIRRNELEEFDRLLTALAAK